MDITGFAPAKVNMALDIVNKRKDGYHEMCMLNHSTGLGDVLTFADADEVSLTCSDLTVPMDHNNLVYKAAMALKAYCDCEKGAAIHIEKKIPMQAGLAGGSADCAAALRGLNKLWHLELSSAELQQIGAALGADVPYCMVNGTALVTGFGDEIKPLPPLPELPILIIKPEVDISTPEGFKMADDREDLFHPKVPLAADVFIQNGLTAALPYLGNSFEIPVFDRWPEIQAVKNKMQDTGAFYTTMSGSGSTLVSYYNDQITADKAYQFFKKEGYRAFLTKIQENRMD